MPGPRKGRGASNNLDANRELAMRNMRFQGHLRGRKGKGGGGGVDSGWGHRNHKVFDEK